MKRSLLLVMLFVVMECGAQTKQTAYSNQIWYGYYPQFKLSKHWGLGSDWELHSKEIFFDNFSRSVFRLAVTYYVTDVTKITAGYCYINDYPADNHLFVSLPEHQGWQQLQWFTYYRKKKLMQWLRLEERYKRNVMDNYTLADSYTFSYRARYNFFYQLPLSKKGIVAHSLSAVIGDELYINFGKNIVNNYFDQNRIFLGLSYAVNAHDNLVFGYMNLFQQLAAGNQYKSMNVIRLSFFQNVDLRKK